MAKLTSKMDSTCKKKKTLETPLINFGQYQSKSTLSLEHVHKRRCKRKRAQKWACHIKIWGKASVKLSQTRIKLPGQSQTLAKPYQSGQTGQT